MQRISLSVVSPARNGNGPGYVTEFLRSRQLEMLRAVTGAPSMRAAAIILRKWAKRFPASKADRRGTGRFKGWRYHLQRVARGLERGMPTYNVFGMRGNDKLPFVTFSALPLFTCPGAGACGQWCYSLRSWKNPPALMTQLQNTLFLRFAPEVIASAFGKLPVGITFRLYVDGDFDGAETVAFWFGLLDARPDIQAYGYTKSWDLLHAYGQSHAYPTNYVLNLSSGGAHQRTTEEQMRALPITRNAFVALKIERPEDVRGNWGHKRYAEKRYHDAVRAAARAAGLGPVFSCPGYCGNCNSHGHVCGSHRFDKVTVVIGVH